MGENMRNPRAVGIDAAKAWAAIFVFIIHLFGFSRVYSLTDNVTTGRFVLFAIEQLVIICVPLFFLSTGYLSRNTSLKKAVLGVISVYLLWVFYCMIYIGVDILWYGNRYTCYDVVMDFIQIGDILTREWYIKSYFIVALFTPLLNIGWSNFTKKNKQQLILVLFILTSVMETLYKVCNISIYPRDLVYPRDSIAAGSVLWPFLYFFIGKYIADYGFRLSKKASLLLFWVCLTCLAIYRGFWFTDAVHAVYVTCYDRVLIVILAVLLFSLLYDIQAGKRMASVYKWTSNAALDTYLSAIILERMVYNDMNLSPEAFLRANWWKTVGVAVILLLWGNLRVTISRKLSVFWKGNTGKTLLAYALTAALIFTVVFSVIGLHDGYYSFYGRNANISGQLVANQATKVNGSIVSNENAVGNITYGPYAKLDEGVWTVSVDYETDQSCFFVDVSTDAGAIIVATHELDKNKNNISFEIEVLDSTKIWEFRTFSMAEGGCLKLHKITVEKQ